ncbi:MAG: nuclease-related domain-containing protein [Coriobacteriia bacterium]
MATVIGTPGESAAARGGLLVLIPVAFVAVVAFPLSILAFRQSMESAGCAGLLVTALLLGALAYLRRGDFGEISDGMREGTQFLKGARGEILVHQALLALPKEYVVFHDFHPLDSAGTAARWNVDHIVVGPNGVFVIDAKYYGKAYVACAAKNVFSARSVKQVQRNSMDLKSGLTKWSGGELATLFVVPIVAYAQPDARMESLSEGPVRTLPLRLLSQEILRHSERALDQEKAGRIARVLFSQMTSDLQYKFKSEFDSYGALSNAARMAMRDQRLANTERHTGEIQPTAVAEVPLACPLCGTKLVRKMAKHGPRAGKPFLGCANYPKTGCRYGFNLEE